MRCGTRTLSLTSLGFGLVATGALSLAVATDYWLYTVEMVEIKLNDTTVTMGMAAAYEELELDDIDAAGPLSDDLPAVGQDGSSMFPVAMHSGLWRMCIINEPIGEYFALYL